MSRPSLLSPEDQSATFVELFFDLVFVFSVTQVVALFHAGFDWVAAGHSVLVFWLVWWAWTQFTWALNAADTTHTYVEVATLGATAVAFFMAVAVPDAFSGGALWFAIPYVAVRGVGLMLYGHVAAANPRQHAAVRTFATLSLGGLAAVLVGAVLGGDAQYGLWGLAILLDVIAAGVGARSEDWDLHAEHFAERHGLIVIIALGEGLIVAAGAVTAQDRSLDVLAVGVLAVLITCGFWWTYFARAKPALEQAMARVGGAARSSMARDAFSLFHFPVLLGVIAFAAAVEEAMLHAGDPVTLAARSALAAGVGLFLVGVGVAVWRATGRFHIIRVFVAAATVGGILAVPDAMPLTLLAVTLVGVLLIAFVEERRGASAT